MNKATLCGNITRDIETRITPSGKTVVNFSIATNKRINGKDETTYHNCVSWGKQGEVIAKYFKKGDKILIEGEINNRSWEKDGIKRYSSDIVVSSFYFVGGNKVKEAEENNLSDEPVEQDLTQGIPF